MILNVASSSLVDQPSKESMTHFSGGVTSTLMKKTPHCNYRRHVILSLFEGTLQRKQGSSRLLVCSCCHAEIHGGLYDDKILSEFLGVWPSPVKAQV